MYSDDLLKRIKQFEKNDLCCRNYQKALLSVAPDFADVIRKWVYGEEPEYEYKGISLTMIREKEKCSYFRAILRMKILTDNPDMVEWYPSFELIIKDWRE